MSQDWKKKHVSKILCNTSCLFAGHLAKGGTHLQKVVPQGGVSTPQLEYQKSTIFVQFDKQRAHLASRFQVERRRNLRARHDVCFTPRLGPARHSVRDPHPNHNITSPSPHTHICTQVRGLRQWRRKKVCNHSGVLLRFSRLCDPAPDATRGLDRSGIGGAKTTAPSQVQHRNVVHSQEEVEFTGGQVDPLHVPSVWRWIPWTLRRKISQVGITTFFFTFFYFIRNFHLLIFLCTITLKISDKYNTLFP